MNIKNDLVGWFLKNAVIPRLIAIDIPGFVIVKNNWKGEKINQRNIFYSEKFMANLETQLHEKLGEKGDKIAYSIGINYGNAYCNSFAIPRIGIDPEKTIDDFILFYSAFMGVTWGEFVQYSYNLKEKTATIDFGNHIVCNKNGLGYAFTSGNIGGGWQYIMQDPTVQSIQTQCIGKGAKTCKVIMGPAAWLDKQGLKHFNETAKISFKIDETYTQMNSPRKLEYSNTSMQKLISTGFFDFKENKLSLNNDRYCFTGLELLYTMEILAKENKTLGQIIFDSAFQQGSEIANNEKDNEYTTFIPDLLAALGFGDSIILKKTNSLEIQTNYYPYMEKYDQINHFYYRGLLSGLLTSFLGKKILLNKFTTDVSSGHLKLHIY
jgi:predicted hydrocarbon binding protein